MIITKEKCQQIIGYNTTGKGRGNPNFTALTNAKIWLANLEFQGRSEARLPYYTWWVNEAETLRMKNKEGEKWHSLIQESPYL